MFSHLSSVMPSILVVEDHPFQLISLEKQLNQLGFFRLTTALDCAEAMNHLQEGRHFDLLLCDQYLSDGSGLDLIQQAHAMGQIDHAVMISGIDELAKRRRLLEQARALGLPVLDFLGKPLPAAPFLQATSVIWRDQS